MLVFSRKGGHGVPPLQFLRQRPSDFEAKAYSELKSDRVLFRVRVGAVRCNEVTNPAEGAAWPDPESGRENQPQHSCQNPAVIDLPNARYDQTQKTC